MQSDFKINIFR